MRSLAPCLVAILLLVPGCDNPPSGIWLATITGGAGFESVHGTATAIVDSGNTVTSISMFGLTADESNAWRIRLGSCGSDGPIFGEHEYYPDLSVRADGSANTSGGVPSPLERRGSYYINVYESGDDLTSVIACGELRRPVS